MSKRIEITPEQRQKWEEDAKLRRQKEAHNIQLGFAILAGVVTPDTVSDMTEARQALDHVIQKAFAQRVMFQSDEEKAAAEERQAEQRERNREQRERRKQREQEDAEIAAGLRPPRPTLEGCMVELSKIYSVYEMVMHDARKFADLKLRELPHYFETDKGTAIEHSRRAIIAKAVYLRNIDHDQEKRVSDVESEDALRELGADMTTAAKRVAANIGQEMLLETAAA